MTAEKVAHLRSTYEALIAKGLEQLSDFAAMLAELQSLEPVTAEQRQAQLQGMSDCSVLEERVKTTLLRTRQTAARSLASSRGQLSLADLYIADEPTNELIRACVENRELFADAGVASAGETDVESLMAGNRPMLGSATRVNEA